MSGDRPRALPLAILDGPTLERLEAALSTSTFDAERIDWLAFVFHDAGRFDRSADLYQRLVDKFPFNSSFHFYLGDCLLRTGQIDRARGHFEQVLRLDRDGEYARRAMVSLSRV